MNIGPKSLPALLSRNSFLLKVTLRRTELSVLTSLGAEIYAANGTVFEDRPVSNSGAAGVNHFLNGFESAEPERPRKAGNVAAGVPVSGAGKSAGMT
jgi:hypothetical protein